jgi:S1-C subfamily serine protease
VAAIIGGLVTALFVFVGVTGLEDGTTDVTFKEASPPVEGGTEDAAGTSVREVYTQTGPGVVSVDVVSSESGPGGGSGFVLDEQGHIVTNQHVVGGPWTHRSGSPAASGSRLRWSARTPRPTWPS